MKKMTSLAKIGGTVISAGGAVSMALLRGPKLLNNPTSTTQPFTSAISGFK